MAIRRNIILGLLATFPTFLVALSTPAPAQDKKSGFLSSYLVDATQNDSSLTVLDNPAFIAFVAGLISYILVFLIFRRLFIVAPEFESLCAARWALDAMLDKENDDINEISNQHKRARKLLEKSRKCLSDTELEGFGVLPWRAASARYCAAWRLLHEAEREIAESEKSASPYRAVTILSRLKENKINGEESQNIFRYLDAFIKNPDQQNPESIVRWVQEGEALLCRAEQLKIQAIQEARNKAFWLIVSAFASVFWLGFMIKASAPLLLAGAIGGLLARLSAAVKDTSTVFDYSVSWMVLFLTPLVGAIAGWFGVAIVQLFVQFSGFDNKTIIDLMAPTGLAFLVAFVFGWSARLFDAAANKLEGQLTRTLEQGGVGKRATGADQMSTQQ